MAVWEARAILEDGTEIERDFPYRANGDYDLEEKEQYKAECWIMEHDGVVWFSVNYKEV